MAKQVTKIPATVSKYTAAPINSRTKRKVAGYARVSTDHDEQLTSYEALVSRFEATKAQYEKVTSEIAMRGIRRREFGRFIKTVENMPQAVTDFDEALWGSLVDKLTVYSKDNIVFTLTSGMEIKA